MRSIREVLKVCAAASLFALVAGFPRPQAASAGTTGGQPSSAPPAAAPTVCGGQPLCTEVSSFAATITDFRTSLASPNKMVTAIVRFQNKKNQPLILGYVDGSGLATDDKGNRYSVNGNTVRSIGLIRGRDLDPKFVLQPGEASDGRFEFTWGSSGREIYGTSFEIELAIREINSVAADQFTLGREHALQFHGLGKSPIAQAPPPAPAVASPQTGPASGGVAPASEAGAPAAVPASLPPPAADPCAGKPRCYGAGPFTAEIAQLVSIAKPGENRKLQVNVKFRNVTQQPVILGYILGSNSAIDNQGNQYTCCPPGFPDRSSSGIGIVHGNQADTQFALKPGESRNATFQLSRGADKSVIGTSFTWNVSIAQLEILPNGQQVNTVREYSLNFPDVAPSAAGASKDSPKSLLDIFKKKH